MNFSDPGTKENQRRSDELNSLYASRGEKQHLPARAYESTTDGQLMQATCEHEWEPVAGYVFEYIPVCGRCLKCGTYTSNMTQNGD